MKTLTVEEQIHEQRRELQLNAENLRWQKEQIARLEMANRPNYVFQEIAVDGQEILISVSSHDPLLPKCFDFIGKLFEGLAVVTPKQDDEQ